MHQKAPKCAKVRHALVWPAVCLIQSCHRQSVTFGQLLAQRAGGVLSQSAKSSGQASKPSYFLNTCDKVRQSAPNCAKVRQSAPKCAKCIPTLQVRGPFAGSLLQFSIEIYLDDFPIPASAKVSLQLSRPRRLSGLTNPQQTLVDVHQRVETQGSENILP